MMVDDQIGEILAYLEASGLRQRSTVFMLSDHGDGWSGLEGDPTNTHGGHFDSLPANKIVLGAQGPGVRPGVTKTLVRTIDLFPTILELARVSAPRSIDGLSLVPALRGGPLEARTLFAETGIALDALNIKKLVAENYDWYEFDPRTGLMQMKPEGSDELLGFKSYMHISGRLRLVVTPYLGKLEVFAFDPEALAERDAPLDLDDAELLDMLAATAAHFGLDRDELESALIDRSFVGLVAANGG